SFLFAALGSFVGISIHLSFGGYWIVAIGGFVVLLALNFLIEKQGLNLFLLYLFTFLEGMSLSPLLNAYIKSGNAAILGSAFIITSLTSLALALYAWIAKRDFSKLGDYLFFGLILLLVCGFVL